MAKKSYGVIAAAYLLGIFIGALDMSIVNPARTVIQNTLGVPDQLGVWLLTIYTLAYAASIPVMGKLADRHGRKYVYLACIALFGIGSLLCGLSQLVQSFPMLIVSRAIQAVGGGGIVPVATAEFGTAFPQEKRGMALGLVGGIYGIASVFGPAAGSALLDLFGETNWQFIFYVNVPICLFVLIAGLAKIPNSKEGAAAPIDGKGILVMTVMILSLMYGLKNINFFDLASSITSLDVWPFLVVFVVLLPLFVFLERRAADPVMNLAYFKDRDILITLACSIITGVIMMANIFMPQFCENALFQPSGSGGYYLIVLGIFAGLGSPLSGKLIDRYGVRPVLGFGFVVAVVGSVFMVFVACPHPNLFTTCVTLALVGLSMGFVMGTPLNYMMLQKTDASQSNSALATLSLVRSIGTSIAPAIMVAFIAHAGMSMQDNIIDAMPQEVTVDPLPYAQEIDDAFDQMAALPQGQALTSSLKDMPKLSSFSTMDMTMDTAKGGDYEIPAELKEKMENADVTTIVGVCKELSSSMFDAMTPALQKKVDEGLDKAIVGVKAAGPTMAPLVAKLDAAKNGVPALFSQAKENYLAEVDASAPQIQKAYQQTLNEGFKGMFVLVGIVSALGVVLVMCYCDARPGKEEEDR